MLCAIVLSIIPLTAFAAQNGYCWNDKVGWVTMSGVTYDTYTRTLAGSATFYDGTPTGLGTIDFTPNGSIGVTASLTPNDIGYYPLVGQAFSEQLGWIVANNGGSNPAAISNVGVLIGNFWSNEIGWFNCSSNDIGASNVHIWNVGTSLSATSSSAESGGGGGGRRGSTTSASMSAFSRSSADNTGTDGITEGSSGEESSAGTASSTGEVLPQESCPSMPDFTDVPSCSWYAPHVDALSAAGVVAGYKDAQGKPLNLFRPSEQVTYAQLVKMALLARTSVTGKPVPPDGVPENASATNTWAAPYIAAAETLHLSQFPASQDVHRPMRRGAVIRTLLDVQGIVPTKQSHSFTDLPLSHPYHDAIATAASLGLITGDTDSAGHPLGTVRPDDMVSRAEAAKIIAILLTGEFSVSTNDTVVGPLPLGIHRIQQPILYLRSAPVAEAAILKVLRRNELVSVLERTGPWAKVERQDGLSGYVYASSLFFVADTWPAPETYVVKAPILNLRGGAFVDAAIRATLTKGARVTVIRTIDVWSQVITEDGQEGYVASYLLEKE